MILHEVLTPEKVPFTYRVAGVGSRCLAWFIDMLVYGMIVVAGSWMFVAFDLGMEGLGTALATIWAFCVQWGYFLLFEWLMQGQTPGKRVVGIRVIQTRGTSISFFQSAVRNLVRVVDSLPVGNVVGFLVAMTNREIMAGRVLLVGQSSVHHSLSLPA